MSDVNELPDYDYDEEHKEEKNGAQDADGKKYVKIHFLQYISESSQRPVNWC